MYSNCMGFFALNSNLRPIYTGLIIFISGENLNIGQGFVCICKRQECSMHFGLAVFSLILFSEGNRLLHVYILD